VGTKVTVNLPLAPAPVEAEEAPAVRPAAQRHGRHLVVEDEPMLRDMARRALERQGYDVVVVTDGASAHRLLEGETPRFDLVLTDVVMPKLNGKELADHIWHRYPGLPVLFMTGYSDQDVLKRGLVVAGASFIQKPFTPERLVEAVARMLEAWDRAGRGASSLGGPGSGPRPAPRLRAAGTPLGSPAARRPPPPPCAGPRRPWRSGRNPCRAAAGPIRRSGRRR
jgi:CheY-like chemotaxis protein